MPDEEISPNHYSWVYMEMVKSSENEDHEIEVFEHAWVHLDWRFPGSESQHKATIIGDYAAFNPVVVSAAWSDQLTDVEVNGMPDATGNDNNPYILMGVQPDGRAYAKLKLAKPMPPALQNKVVWRFAKRAPKGSTAIVSDLINGQSTYSADGSEVHVRGDDIVNADDKDYLIVWGFTPTGGSQLAPNGIPHCLQKLKGYRKDHSKIAHVPFVFTIVSEDRYSDSILNTENAAVMAERVLPIATRSITAFLHGERPPQTSGSRDITITRLQRGLSHPVGINFTPVDTPGEGKCWFYDEDSDVTSSFLSQSELQSLIKGKFLHDHAQEISDARKNIAHDPRAADHAFTYSWKRLVGQDDYEIPYASDSNVLDMKFTFGHVVIDGDITFVVNLYTNTVVCVTFVGRINDVFDFDYNAKFLGTTDLFMSGIKISISPARAAEVQAGFPTLGDGGAVFLHAIVCYRPVTFTGLTFAAP